MTDWFKGRGLAFALGLNLTFARIATALGDNISPWITDRSSPPYAGWFGLGVCVVSLLSAFVILHLDRPESRALAGVGVPARISQPSGPTVRVIHEATETSPLLRRREETEPEAPKPPLSVVTDPVIYHPVERPSGNDDDDTTDMYSGYESEEFDERDDETIYCSQVFTLSVNFWLLGLATVLLYACAVPFFHICTDFFQRKYRMDSQTAGFVMSVPDWISAAGSPLAGIFMDMHGHRGTMLPISGVLLILTHSISLWTDLSPYWTMTVMGIAYSLFAAALWPCVPYLVGPHQIATGYGLLTIALNVSLFVFPLIVAQIRASGGNIEDFGPTLFFFIVLGALAVLVTLAINVIDRSSGGSALNSTGEGPAHPVVEIEVCGGADDEELGGACPPGFATSSAGLDVRRGSVGSRGSIDIPDDHDAVRVMGDGIVVVTPHTFIHHHHHRRLSHSNVGAGDMRGHQPDSDHAHHFAHEDHRLCHCAETNGGLSPVRGRRSLEVEFVDVDPAPAAAASSGGGFWGRARSASGQVAPGASASSAQRQWGRRRTVSGGAQASSGRATSPVRRRVHYGQVSPSIVETSRGV
ncbi:hypothetical protein HK101_009808 [Irineochytrium annulatum]|nr:hypothetical protein HK101_009808 [Irineochytrium annulatum]